MSLSSVRPAVMETIRSLPWTIPDTFQSCTFFLGNASRYAVTQWYGNRVLLGLVSELLDEKYRQMPQHFLAFTRALLTSNETLAAMMESRKYHFPGILACTEEQAKQQLKMQAGAFEVVLALYKIENSPTAVTEWGRKNLGPILDGAAQTYWPDVPPRLRQQRESATVIGFTQQAASGPSNSASSSTTPVGNTVKVPQPVIPAPTPLSAIASSSLPQVRHPDIPSKSATNRSQEGTGSLEPESKGYQGYQPYRPFRISRSTPVRKTKKQLSDVSDGWVMRTRKAKLKSLEPENVPINIPLPISAPPTGVVQQADVSSNSAMRRREGTESPEPQSKRHQPYRLSQPPPDPTCTTKRLLSQPLTTTSRHRDATGSSSPSVQPLAGPNPAPAYALTRAMLGPSHLVNADLQRSSTSTSTTAGKVIPLEPRARVANRGVEPTCRT